MEELLEELLCTLASGALLYGFCEIGLSIIYHAKKLNKKSKFLDNYQINDTNTPHNKYIIAHGTAEKTSPRYGNYIDNDIIISISNTTYYEDYFLKTEKNKFYIQPYQGTRMHDITSKYIQQGHESISFY